MLNVVVDLDGRQAMNHSVIQLAGSSEGIFRAWQVLRQSQGDGKAASKRQRKPGK